MSDPARSAAGTGGGAAGAQQPAATTSGTTAGVTPGSGGQSPASSGANAASTSTGQGAAGASASAGAAETLSLALTSAIQRGDAAGVVGLVVDRNGVLFEGAAGQLNVASGEAMPVNAIFNIASMTKPVTSVAIMMLVEQGELDIDDPVSMYLPGFDQLQVLTTFDAASGAFEAAPAQNVMTVRHLLSHTSGIGYAFCNSTVARLQQGTQLTEWEIPLLSEPGTEWHYSASTRVLGLIVESISGQPLEAFFQERIFAPLGMHDTSYAVAADKQSRVPTLHFRGADGSLQETPQNGVPSTPTPPFTGDGGLYSTARDYGQFMRMLLNGGALGEVRLLSAQSVAQMGENHIGDIVVEQQEAANPTLTRPFPLGAGSDKFGLGFQITTAESDGARRSAGSLAWAGLFNTEFWIDPRQGVAATLLMQVLPFYDEGALRALSDFEAAVYRELVPRTSN